MSVIVHYRSAGTIEQYGLAMKKMKGLGLLPFPGNYVRAAYEVDGLVQITEIWENEKFFAEYQKMSVPLMVEAGMQPKHPELRSLAEIYIEK